MEITAALVKELRETTGAGMMDCKRALADTAGDLDKAAQLLREKGIVAAQKKAGRVASEGLVEAYVHAGGKIGVLVEVNCETDFVARSDEFKELAHELALQVAAAQPRYVHADEVPQEVLDREREIFRAQAREAGKPEKVIEQMVTGRIGKYLQEICLLEQPYIKEPKRKVADLVQEAVAKLGENIRVRRFARFETGEGLEKREDDFAAEVQRQVGV